MGSQQEVVLLGYIPLEIQELPNIPKVKVMQVDETPEDTWMTPILAYINKGTLPEKMFRARRLCYKAARYVVCDEILYKSGFNQPLLRYFDEKKGNYILREIWDPYKLVFENRKQFDSKELWRLCEDLKIKKEFTEVYHPQSNGPTEAVNKIIKHTLKTNVEERKGKCLKELPKVLWSYKTTPRSTTGESSFMLTYAYETMVPVEVGSGSLRRDHYAEGDAEVNQRPHLNLLEEARENSQLHLVAYQQRATTYYNKKLKEKLLKVGDLILWKVMPNTKNPQRGVFGANWEGPYIIKAILWKGIYHLEDLEGKLVPRA
ncbi:uncharacterized protein LOC141660466 [Apium graveolens]|uniref:uncharacterized protein LOC141660466 n=1 Tax=Apium graveolens TaxID=4045 RepID=UPI003D7B8778